MTDDLTSASAQASESDSMSTPGANDEPAPQRSQDAKDAAMPPNQPADATQSPLSDPTAATRLLQDLVSDSAQYGQEAISRQVRVMTSLATAKSPQEALEIQTKYSRMAIEAFLAHSSRMTQVMSELVSGSSKAMNIEGEPLIKLGQRWRR